MGNYGNIKVVGDLRPKTLAGAVRYVGPNCTYTTIQAALTASSAGDTVLVMPGTYTETITFTANNITVKSLGDYTNTIISRTTENVVNFSTYYGCVIEGFTVAITNSNSYTKAAINSANSATTGNGTNLIRGCKVTYTGTVNFGYQICIYVTDGDLDVEDCILYGYSSYAGSSESTFTLLRLESSGTHVINFRRTTFEISNLNYTGAGGDMCLNVGYNSSATTNCYSCSFIINSKGNSSAQAFMVQNVGILNLYNCHTYVNLTQSGSLSALYQTSGTMNVYGGSVNTICAGTNNATYYGGTMNLYGLSIIGSGALTSAGGTLNLYGINKNDSGYGVVSPATTGGTGTAGSGNQYFPLTINGVTYKCLHDGTV